MSSDPDPRIIVLTAPSGAGKTTVAHRLLEVFPEMRFSVSATTRPRREAEIHGVHYHFLTQAQFEQALLDGELLEYEEVYADCWYATLRSEVARSSAERPVLLDIDVKGALNIKDTYGDHAFVLFIRPPSLDVLESRLRARNSESDDSLGKRLAKARDELAYADRFDAVVVNDHLESAVEEACSLISDYLLESRA